jgi:hypothetical protein
MFEELQVAQCSFATLPDRAEGCRGEGMTAAKMALCGGSTPFIVVRIEFLERTPEDQLRQSEIRR